MLKFSYLKMSLNLQSHTISQRKSLKLKGTKPSVTKNQILVSTGIVSLDAVLGIHNIILFLLFTLLITFFFFYILLFLDGGIPIGTITLLGILSCVWP